MSAVSTSPTEGVPDNSPFDTIKHTREDGSEFWSARDLMKLTGIHQVANFDVAKPFSYFHEKPDSRGASRPSYDVDSQQFWSSAPSRRVSSRWQIDVELSRFACVPGRNER
jgi:hypothetical protein